MSRSIHHRRILCVLLAVLLCILPLTGCDGKPNAVNSTTTTVTSAATTTTVTESQTVEQTTSSTQTAVISNVSKATTTATKKVSTTAAATTVTTVAKTTVTTKEPTTTTTKTDPLTPDTFEEDGVQAYAYTGLGTAVDWLVDGDLFHVLFSSRRYVVFDGLTGQIVKQMPLPGRPAELHFFGNELWISFPDMCCIRIYDAASLGSRDTLYFDHEISSFDVYNDYLFYTEDDQHVNAFRYTISTGEIKQFNESYYFADVVTNPEAGLVYICECNSTGSEVIAYNIESMELTSCFKKNNYGYSNVRRRTFLFGDGLYWGEFKLDPNDVSRVLCQYSGNGNCGMLQVDEMFIVTTKGMFLTATGESLLSFSLGATHLAVMVSASGAVMECDGQTLTIVPPVE